MATQKQFIISNAQIISLIDVDRGFLTWSFLEQKKVSAYTLVKAE
jgi:hypothetical protein